MTSAQPLTKETRDRVYRGFRLIQAAFVIQLLPLVATRYVWQLYWAVPVQTFKWLAMSVYTILAGLQLLVFILVARGLYLLDCHSSRIPLMHARIRRIHMALILLMAWSFVQFISQMLRFVDVLALPWHPIFWDIVYFAQALAWFVVLFNGILIAKDANHHLGDLRFSYPTLVLLLSVSLLLWMVHTTYTMYRGEFIFPQWVWVAISYGIPALTIGWLIWGFILLGIARRRIALIMRCPRCSYNLTGNKSGTCPECGEPISISPSSAPGSTPEGFAGRSA